MGAWIETSGISNGVNAIGVAPCMGAWIETAFAAQRAALMVSHPVWVRGLKPQQYINDDEVYPSHPVWVRGLKQLFMLY